MNLDGYINEIRVGLRSNPTQTLHEYRGPCPFCGGNTRFLVSPPSPEYPRGGYLCQSEEGCRKHGNLVHLVMELQKCDEETACSILGIRPPRSFTKAERRQYAIAKKYGLDIAPAEKPITVPANRFMLKEWSPAIEHILHDAEGRYDCFLPAHRKYLADHGFDANSVIACGVRSRMQGRQYAAADLGLPDHYGDIYVPAGVYFPLKDIQGKLFGIKVRQFGAKSKYFEISKGYRPCAFARPYRANLSVIVTESENDALLLDTVFGDAINIFAIGGVNKPFDKATDAAIRQCPWFIIALDADAAGQAHAHRIQELYPDSHIAIIPSCCKDPSEAQKLGVDLRLWLMSNLPPLLQARTKALLGTGYPEEIMAVVSTTWQIRHAINTGSIQLLPNQESLATILGTLPSGTPVAVMFPPKGPWSIAFENGVFSLDTNLAEDGGYDLSAFDLDYIALDPYSSRRELSLLHIEDKPVASVRARINYEEHKTKKEHAKLFFPDTSSAYGLLAARSVFDRRFTAAITAFITKLEQARPYIANPAGLPYDCQAYNRILTEWAANESLKGKVSEYRKADTIGKGILPVNYEAFGTVTGRFNTHDPNVQGIDRHMRRAFTAPEGWQYVSIDFHMVQPRIIAAVCGDDAFRFPFLSGQDYYKHWITKVVEYDGEITKPMRNFFKTPSLALLYGMNPENFAKELSEKATSTSLPEITALNLDVTKCRSIASNFAREFPVLAQWNASNKAQARQTGFAKTMSGRPMPLPITSRGVDTHAATCYFAQGTEAEIMLDAIIDFGQQVDREHLKAYIALCLHDELLICCPDNEVDHVELLAKVALTNAFSSRFPEENTDQLLEINSAPCWGDLK